MSKVPHLADIFKKLPCGCTSAGYLGHTLHPRRSFVDSLYKKCRNCNDGVKKQTTKLELTSMPHSIIIGLNRGIPNANGVTIDKDETKVNLEKEFYLELPNGDRKKFTLVATSQHTGKFRICVNVSVFLKLVLQIPYMRVWLISTCLILHFHQET